MRGVRRKTAEHLAESWNTIPHVTQQDRADITELEQLRARFAPKAQEAGGKMTVTAIALKVCAAALKVFPQFNASIDIEKEEIVYKQYINIGVAADTDRGLLVPVIRDVDKKSVYDIGTEGQAPYLVTELLEGESLGTRIRRGKMPWREAVDVGIAVAEAALAAALRAEAGGHDVSIHSYDKGRFERSGEGVDLATIAAKATA